MWGIYERIYRFGVEICCLSHARTKKLWQVRQIGPCCKARVFRWSFSIRIVGWRCDECVERQDLECETDVVTTN